MSDGTGTRYKQALLKMLADEFDYECKEIDYPSFIDGFMVGEGSKIKAIVSIRWYEDGEDTPLCISYDDYNKMIDLSSVAKVPSFFLFRVHDDMQTNKAGYIWMHNGEERSHFKPTLVGDTDGIKVKLPQKDIRWIKRRD